MSKQLIVAVLLGSFIGTTAPALGIAQETNVVRNAPKVTVSADAPWYKKTGGWLVNKYNSTAATITNAVKVQTDPGLKLEAILKERDLLLVEIESLKRSKVETRVTGMIALEDAKACVQRFDIFLNSVEVTQDPAAHLLLDRAKTGGRPDG